MLEGIARRMKAVAIACYEAGRTLAKSPGGDAVPDTNWTGQIYLVAAWANVDASARTQYLEGFPAALSSHEHAEIKGVIVDRMTTHLVEDGPMHKSLFDSQALEAAEAKAAILAGASFNQEFPAVIILYYQSPADAARQLAMLREHRNHDYVEDASGRYYLDETALRQDVQRALEALGTNLMHRAVDQHFAFLSWFQKTYLQGMLTHPMSQLEAPFAALMKEAIDDLARDIHCPDVRVYLAESPTHAQLGEDDPADALPSARQFFALQWHSWPEAPKAAVRLDDVGPIGWCLRNRKSIYIHNRDVLARFGNECRVVYPGLDTLDSVGELHGNPAALLRPDPLPPNPLGPPVSLLLHPIVVANIAVGVIVCNGRNAAPYVFHDWDDTSLGFVALAIANTWINIQHRKLAKQDNQMLLRAAQEISDYSRRIGQWIAAEAVSEDEIYQEALHTADRIVGVRSQFSSIRLIDPDTRLAHFRYKSGSRWDRRAVAARFASSTFLVSEQPPTTAAAQVYQSRLPYFVRVAANPDAFRATFPGEMEFGLYVPIFDLTTSRKVIGILDIRTAEDDPFPRSTPAVLSILTEMIGLTLTLIAQVRELRESNELLRAKEDEQVLIFEDLAHQVMTPLRASQGRLNRLEPYIVTDASPRSAAARQFLDTTQALVRRCMRVSMAARFFKQLRETGEILQSAEEHRALIGFERIMERIKQIISDQELLQEAGEAVTFHLDLGSFRRSYEAGVGGDLVLFEQAVANLVENASKYSRPGTVVDVRATTSRDRSHFVIEITNFGLPIPASDRSKLVLRGYRHSDAKLTRPEGQGIGLWLVDHIMRSFGGQLEPQLSTSRAEPHRFRLLFPYMQKGHGR